MKSESSNTKYLDNPTKYLTHSSPHKIPHTELAISPTTMKAKTLRRYQAVLIEFMSFRAGMAYPADAKFTPIELLAITDEDVVSFLNKKAYGKAEVGENDRPTCGRSSSLRFSKKALSHFMPRKYVHWDDITLQGNPTMSSAVKRMIREVEQFEARGEGVRPNARRPLEWEEMMDIFIAAHNMSSIQVSCTMLAVLTMQWQFIGRIDDVMKLATQTVVKHMLFPFALNLKMCWSKNIMTERECPTQILFAAMNPLLCPMLRLGIYLETVGTHGDLLFPQSNKSSADQLGVLFESSFFTSLREGKLGTHSVRKGAATYAGRCGLPTEWIEQRGRWRGKKRQVETYIDVNKPYPDARVAGCLCGQRGPCKYAVKDGMAVPDTFLEEITPNACAVVGVDVARVLALPLLWAAYERVFITKGHEIVMIPERLAVKIKQAWIRSGGLVDVNPIEKIPLTIHQMGDQLVLGTLALPPSSQALGSNIQRAVGNQSSNRGDAAMEDVSVAAVVRPAEGGVFGDPNNSEFQVLYSLVYSLSQRLEDHDNKMHDLFAAQNRYMQGMNTNIRHTSAFKPSPSYGNSVAAVAASTTKATAAAKVRVLISCCIIVILLATQFIVRII